MQYLQDQLRLAMWAETAIKAKKELQSELDPMTNTPYPNLVLLVQGAG